jgi:hypothetical protein
VSGCPPIETGHGGRPPEGAGGLPGGSQCRVTVTGLIALLLLGVALGGAAVLLVARYRSAHRAAPPAAPAAVAEPSPAPAETVAAPRMVFSLAPVRPKETPPILEAGAPVVHCFVDVPDAPRTAKVALRWVATGKPPADAKATVALEPGDHLQGHAALRPPGGAPAFAPGIYEVELRVDGERVLEGSFAMLKGSAELMRVPKGMERYRPEVKDLVVATGRPGANAGKPFVLPAAPVKIVVRFRYAYALPGTAFTVQWIHEGGLIAQATTEINIQKDSGTGEAWFAPKPPAKLPTGRYGVIVSLGEGTPPLAKEDFWVGRRPRPDELPPSPPPVKTQASAR